MKRILYIIIAAACLAACADKGTKKVMTRAERLRMKKAESAALKIAVMPTLDCLPLFVARECRLFDTLGVDVRLKYFKAQMDVDTALAGCSVEGGVSDLVRTERLKQKGTPLDYLTATDGSWQLVVNRTARIKQLKQLDDKMLAMTRFSATDRFSDIALDSAKLKYDRVYRVQINDVNLRLLMLLNNEMDALWLPEPQATVARHHKHGVLMDSRKMKGSWGVLAIRTDRTADKSRQEQLKLLVKAYNTACDSINKRGVAHYMPLIEKYCKQKKEHLKKLPADLRFRPVAKPAEEDVNSARQWLEKKSL